MFDALLRYEYWFAATQLTCAMLGMGATLRLHDFVGVFRRPRALVIGLAVQIAGVPLVTAALLVVLDPMPGIAVGLALVAAVPGGAMSNLFAFLARGNVPLSIALTACTTAGCLVTTPIVLDLLAAGHIGEAVTMPVARIGLDIVCFLLLPLAVGMAIGAHHPEHRQRFATWCIRASLLVIGCLIVISAGAGRLDLGAYGVDGVAAVVLLAFLAQQVAWVPAWLFRLGPRDGVTLAIETTIRNTNLALLVKASVFPAIPGAPDPVADGALFVALLYGGVALPVALPAIFWGYAAAPARVRRGG